MSLRRRCKSLLTSLLSAVYRKAAATTVIRQNVTHWRPAEKRTHKTHAPLAQACLTADRRQVDGRHLDSNRERKMVEAMPAVRSRGDEVPAGGKMFHYQYLFVTIIIFFFCCPVLQMTQNNNNKKADVVPP